jgi:hypothetical protein
VFGALGATRSAVPWRSGEEITPVEEAAGLQTRPLPKPMRGSASFRAGGLADAFPARENRTDYS